jgi:hypothetical protein
MAKKEEVKLEPLGGFRDIQCGEEAPDPAPATELAEEKE